MCQARSIRRRVVAFTPGARSFLTDAEPRSHCCARCEATDIFRLAIWMRFLAARSCRSRPNKSTERGYDQASGRTNRPWRKDRAHIAPACADTANVTSEKVIEFFKPAQERA